LVPDDGIFGRKLPIKHVALFFDVALFPATIDCRRATRLRDCLKDSYLVALFKEKLQFCEGKTQHVLLVFIE